MKILGQPIPLNSLPGGATKGGYSRHYCRHFHPIYCAVFWPKKNNLSYFTCISNIFFNRVRNLSNSAEVLGKSVRFWEVLLHMILKKQQVSICWQNLYLFSPCNIGVACWYWQGNTSMTSYITFLQIFISIIYLQSQNLQDKCSIFIYQYFLFWPQWSDTISKHYR